MMMAFDVTDSAGRDRGGGPDRGRGRPPRHSRQQRGGCSTARRWRTSPKRPSDALIALKPQSRLHRVEGRGPATCCPGGRAAIVTMPRCKSALARPGTRAPYTAAKGGTGGGGEPHEGHGRRLGPARAAMQCAGARLFSTRRSTPPLVADPDFSADRAPPPPRGAGPAGGIARGLHLLSLGCPPPMSTARRSMWMAG